MRITSPAPQHARSTAAAAAVLLVASLLAGCSQGGSEDPPDAVPTTASASTPATTPSPSPTPSASPTPAPRPTDTSGGDGDGEDDDQPATAGGGICSDLGAEAVGAVLGVAVTGKALAGGGCGFDPKDPAAPAVTVIDTPYRPKPGMAGAKTGATSSVEGEPEDLPSLGDAAFVVTGTAFGGDDVQGAGAVRLGDRLVAVTVDQSAGLGRAKVRSLVVGVLRLAASKAG